VRVEEVEVEEEALPPRGAHRWAPAPVGEPKAAAGLDRREDTDEPRGDPVASGDLPGPLVLAHRGLEVLPRPARSLGHEVGVRPQPFRLLKHEALQLFEEHALALEQLFHGVWVAEWEVALEEDAFETRERPGRRSGVLGNELPHGSPPPIEGDVRRMMLRPAASCQAGSARGLTAAGRGFWLRP
jgi:hypothetical protein